MKNHKKSENISTIIYPNDIFNIEFNGKKTRENYLKSLISNIFEKVEGIRITSIHICLDF